MRKKINKWPLLILIANIAFFFIYTSYFSFNFPMQDDVTLIEFIVSKEQNKTDILTLAEDLFRVDNDHSIAVPRIITWINQGIEGSLNFKRLTQFISLLLLVIFLFILRRFHKRKLDLHYILPVSFLLFQPHFYEVINWPITGLQHINILLFVVIALELLDKEKSLFWPILCAFLAGFTFGNGVALFVLLAFYLFFEGRNKEVKWVLLALGIYFLALVPIFKFSQHAKFGFSFYNTSFFAFGILGSIALEFTKNRDLFAVGFGSILMGFIVYFGYQKWLKNNPKIDQLYFYLLIFVLGAILVIAIPRSGNDWTLFHSSRYFVYSVIAMTCLYLIGIAYVPYLYQKPLFYTILAFSIIFSFLSYYNNSESMINRFNILRADHDNWKRNKAVICEIPQVFQNVKPSLDLAYANHWIKEEKTLIPSEDLSQLNEKSNPLPTKLPLEIQNHADTVKGKSEFWISRYSYLIFDRMEIDNPISKAWFLVIQNDSTKKCFLSPISFKRRALREFIFKPGSNYLSKSGAAIVRPEFIEAGKYHLYICASEENKKNSYYKINYGIQIDSLSKWITLLP